MILPSTVTLNGPEARQRLLVERVRDQKFVGQVTNGVELSSSDPRILRIENGIARPVTNGVATVRAQVGAQTATAQITVTAMEKPSAWSFRNQVEPVLANLGCSSGACHGAAAGKNGFKLSLRGYDEQADYLMITRNALGRRVVLSDPGRSLILLKPTTTVPHKGGLRFTTNSLEYRVLSEWIAAGTPGPKPEDPRIDRLEVLPDHVVLKAGDRQQLVVRAHFSDGHAEDVTRWAKYTSANTTVATVDDDGAVEVIGHGEGAITAWYLSRISIATVTAPYEHQVPREIFANAGHRNFIDDLVLEKLQDLNLPPSPRCTDAEFIRRAFVDTIGVLPAVKETRDFLANRSPKKRDELIETLLKRPEFVDYWAYKWSDLLLVQSRRLRPAAMWAYYDWIRDNVAANTPWDVFARRIVTAQSSTLKNGAANFYVLHDDPRLMSETVCQAFLGMSINCAKCHNHPMEKWTNDQYYQMANLFARVRAKNGGGDGEEIIFVANAGDLVQPRTGRPQPPTPLDGKPLSLDDPRDRREAAAAWLTSRDNPYFTRAIVNRVWANFMGVGLVESVDDLRVTNPASNEKLLTAAAHFLADHKFNLKALMRAILQSGAYQRSSEPLPENEADARYYARYYPRRLMAEVLLDAVSEVTGVPSKFPGYPDGWRAMQLPDSNVDSYFLKSFGRPDRNNTCACERTAEPSVAQILHLSNGDTLNQKLEAKENGIAKLLAAQTTNDHIVETAYLSALARYPTDAEKQKILQTFAMTKESDRSPEIEDLYWALLTSKEFLFNH
ncbi:MAG: DUF1549 domain-containing protein [Limisphaerales bacterium]